MKILVVCQYYHPEPFRISDICATLVQEGHEVMVVTGTPNYPEGEIYPGYEGTAHRDEVLDGVRVHRCPIHPRKRGAVHRFWNYYSFVWASSRYLSKLEEDFDVVFVNQLSPIMMAEGALRWAKRHGKRCVLYCLDLWPESLAAGGIRPGSLIYRLFWHISRRIYGGVDAIAVPSRGYQSYFEEILKLKDISVFYLPQYAEVLFDSLPDGESHSETLNAVFAGNIGETQSVETIIEAARLLKDNGFIQFHIIGSGSRLATCQELAQGLTNVKFYGRRAISEMPKFYAMADVMLMTLNDDPTLANISLPGKFQSYLAAGKPVVGAINGETAAIITDAGCGLCGPSEDADSLAMNLQYMCEHRELLQGFGENARAYYQENFRKDVFINKLIVLLHENSGV